MLAKRVPWFGFFDVVARQARFLKAKTWKTLQARSVKSTPGLFLATLTNGLICEYAKDMTSPISPQPRERLKLQPLQTKPCCGLCEFWDPSQVQRPPQEGAPLFAPCRRYPPQLLLLSSLVVDENARNDDPPIARQPELRQQPMPSRVIVSQHDWCGEFKAPAMP
jgi:hypothetical protein